jgi:N-acetylneuraminic acid mutarotase
MTTAAGSMLVLILAAACGEIRTWTDVTGNFQVEAEFVELQDGKVVLRKKNGKTTTVALARLCEADREYVRGLAAPPDDATAAEPPGWHSAGALSRPSGQHSLTLLADGRVLVAGGGQADQFDAVAGAEVFDPDAGRWRKTGDLTQARRFHTATLLADGRVLAVGGQAEGKTLTSAEFYDPESGKWAATSPPQMGRYDHTATLLNDGRVLIAGGVDDRQGYPTATAEVYDPATERWSDAGELPGGRYDHTATVLSDGRVLVVGGMALGTRLEPRSDCAIFDPASSQWSATGSLEAARTQHGAALLPDGRVLVVGYGEPAEVYDPAAGTWSRAGMPNFGHANCTVTSLADGRVLVAGGRGAGAFGLDLSHCEVFDGADDSWTAVPDPADLRSGHEAVLLASGRVLIVGGFDKDSNPTASAEDFSPEPAAGD